MRGALEAEQEQRRGGWAVGCIECLIEQLCGRRRSLYLRRGFGMAILSHDEIAASKLRGRRRSAPLCVRLQRSHSSGRTVRSRSSERRIRVAAVLWAETKRREVRRGEFIVPRLGARASRCALAEGLVSGHLLVARTLGLGGTGAAPARLVLGTASCWIGHGWELESNAVRAAGLGCAECEARLEIRPAPAPGSPGELAMCLPWHGPRQDTCAVAVVSRVLTAGCLSTREQAVHH